MAQQRLTFKTIARNTVLGSLVVGLTGCAEGVDFGDPSFPFRSSYATMGRVQPVALGETEWWNRFGDSTLNHLMTAGLRDNIDIEIAKERIIEARASYLAVNPNGNFTVTGNVLHTVSTDAPDSTAVNLDGNFNWLLDVDGPLNRRGALLREAGANIELRHAQLHAARLLLLNEIATAYVNLRFNQQVLGLRQGELRSRRETRGLILSLIEENAATELDRSEADALIAETEAQIPPLQAAIQGSTFQLATLLGRQPGDLPVALGSGTLPHPQMNPNVGIPADLLRNRPDIDVAEQAYYAAVARANFAEADLWPRLSLTGTISLDRVASQGVAAAVFGPSVTLPALPEGPRVATMRARESAARQAHLEWEQTVLEALGEVESVIVSYDASLRSAGAAQRALASRREARELTRERVDTGIEATITDLLDAEVDVAQASVNLAQRRRQVALDFINLHIALGAGHHVYRYDRVIADSSIPEDQTTVIRTKQE